MESEYSNVCDLFPHLYNTPVKEGLHITLDFVKLRELKNPKGLGLAVQFARKTGDKVVYNFREWILMDWVDAEIYCRFFNDDHGLEVTITTSVVKSHRINFIFTIEVENGVSQEFGYFLPFSILKKKFPWVELD